MSSKSWGIIGGGIMGMTLAHNLTKLGQKVTVFEASPELGGLVSSWKIGDIEWDKFYHVILLSDFRTRNILKDIGLEDHIQWVETKTGFYVKGQLYSMSDIIEFLNFPTLNLIDKFRLGLTIIAASKIKNWKRLEKIPVTTWLKRWSGINTYNKIWLPLLRAKLGEDYKNTSAVFIWATIQRLYGARKSGLKKEMFGFIPGGYKIVVQSFKKSLIEGGVQIKTNYEAQEVTPLKSGKINVKFSNECSEEFDQVILTLPSPISSSICRKLSDLEKKQLNSIEYLGVICVTVMLNKSISDYYITNITDEDILFTGVIEMSALVDKKYLNNKALVYLPKYISSNDPLFKKTDEEIKGYFIENLKKMYGWITDDNIKFVGVARAKYVITIPKLNYSESLPNIQTTIPGLYIINTSHIKDGTLNVNETVKVAENKLKEIIK